MCHAEPIPSSTQLQIQRPSFLHAHLIFTTFHYEARPRCFSSSTPLRLRVRIPRLCWKGRDYWVIISSFTVDFMRLETNRNKFYPLL